MEPDSMVELQKGWYQALTPQLGLDPGTFQISLPMAPIAERDNAVWDYRDVIPPNSVTFNRLLHKVLRFSGQYAAVVNLTGGISDALEGIIGKEAYAKWSEFLVTQTPPPHLAEWPELFLKWAMMRRPAVATAGASALARGILETTAQPAMPREYRGTYRELREELRAAGGAVASFHSEDITAGKSGIWTGTDTGLDGLWAGASADSSLSRKFARSGVAVEMRFERYAISPSHPGPWFREEALRTAFENPESPPWPASPAPVWKSFFGCDGSLPRAIDSLVLVDGIDATITSNVVFSPDERAQVESNAAKGMWPFYAANSGVVTNEVACHGSSLEARIVTKPGNPVVAGNNVLSIARYLRRSSGLSMHP